MFEKFKGLRTHAGESHRPTGFRKDERLFCFRNLRAARITFAGYAIKFVADNKFQIMTIRGDLIKDG